MRACRLSYSRASTAVMPTKIASARAFACCLESVESSAERFFVNVATVSLHSRNRPSPIFRRRTTTQTAKYYTLSYESLGAVSDCAVPDGRRVGGKVRYRRLDTRLNLANNATFWRCSACHGWCQCASILVQTATGRENLEAYGNSIPIIHSVFHNSVEN